MDSSADPGSTAGSPKSNAPGPQQPVANVHANTILKACGL